MILLLFLLLGSVLRRWISGSAQEAREANTKRNARRWIHFTLLCAIFVGFARPQNLMLEKSCLVACMHKMFAVSIKVSCRLEGIIVIKLYLFYVRSNFRISNHNSFLSYVNSIVRSIQSLLFWSVLPQACLFPTAQSDLCNILSCDKTEGIMSWKVQLHTVGINAVREQQARLLLRRVMGSGGLCGELCKAVK